ncbi:uncharacterized protein LOC114075087 [Solanum pennellii]|uniref:Uncharacterized protein LOC114075087 n=1 Tax=Solanum pennellii TaxID=28526 RepID=A0ABM1V072_SOLPN|nr:uncharacterized protein LOC114075087 [Solanum pennellii]
MTGIPIFLSSEIIWNMMSYLSVKSVLRFKCVCKNWNVIIQDFQFICLHYERSPASITKKPPGTTTEEVEFKPLDSVGLLLEYSSTNTTLNYKYRVRNPEIQHQIFEIPDSQHFIVNMSLVFDPLYHVLKLLSYIHDNQLVIGYEVLDLCNEEGSYSWRPLVRKGETRLSSPIIKRSKIKALFALRTGYIIWDIASATGIDIVDMVNDSYIGHINFPTSNFYNKHDDCILWNEKLSLAKLVKDELHVLLLDKAQWADVSLIIKLPFVVVSAVQEQITVIRCGDSDKLMFKWKNDTDKKKEPLCFYNIKTGKLEISRLNCTELFNYVYRRPCLVTFKGINT